MSLKESNMNLNGKTLGLAIISVFALMIMTAAVVVSQGEQNGPHLLTIMNVAPQRRKPPLV